MQTRRNSQNKSQRLAKGVPKAPEHAKSRRARENPVREIRGGDAGRALADERELPPLARLMGAFDAKGIRFQVIGMSAANIQGVPASTLDVDLWMDLPSRSYMRPINIALGQGAQMVRNTVVELGDGTLVNFAYAVTGLPPFRLTFPEAVWMEWNGMKVAVLPLHLIEKSKRAIGRPKDLVHLELIRMHRAVKGRTET